MLAELFTIENLFTLLMLILLQAVLGFDNLLYISLESKKAPAESRKKVRQRGISIAIVLRIALLFLLVSVIQYFQTPFLSADKSFIHFEFNFHSIIVLGGGGFIMYTAIKEIWHMISHHTIETNEDSTQKTAKAVIISIVIMNLVFSFDSILSAMALTNHIGNVPVELVLMSIAIIISGLIMIFMADKVAEFLQKNRMYEVLGLFVLLIVGVMLLTEGGHIAHLRFFGYSIEPMSKVTFYFIIITLVIVDLIQSKYQKNIIKGEQAEIEAKKLK
ncbi:tellurium resistance protein TerC [Putridiphycobacter roseus]|uniref:Tellurium resistance protein TerC n=1 Tax=Putridiphycobacter roseus TaxID=2219161 RepID=A0A2W1N3R5_9FLAO|nr:tellurium resistance protein TerC [Putridiphycobacter roseus]PZE18220.1 tellurium resistance protein TerC [Putridiphycobacter roseus]